MHLDASTRILITGGGSGIGRALALELARNGCKITVREYIRNEVGSLLLQP